MRCAVFVSCRQSSSGINWLLHYVDEAATNRFQRTPRPLTHVAPSTHLDCDARRFGCDNRATLVGRSECGTPQASAFLPPPVLRGTAGEGVVSNDYLSREPPSLTLPRSTGGGEKSKPPEVSHTQALAP